MNRERFTWFIDLDNTLHNASHAVFPEMHLKMNDFMARLLGDGTQLADAETVDATRRRYWKQYGATLLGLIRHHGVIPDEFLRHAHQFDDLPGMLQYERGLSALIRRLPGRKILLTNAPRQYSGQVVKMLGLHRYFDHQIAIESMRVHGRLRPKPSVWMLKKLLARHGLKPHHCALVEDSLDNLRAAKRIGMKTVWVTQYARQGAERVRHMARPGFVDSRISSVRSLDARLGRLAQ